MVGTKKFKDDLTWLVEVGSGLQKNLAQDLFRMLGVDVLDANHAQEPCRSDLCFVLRKQMENKKKVNVLSMKKTGDRFLFHIPEQKDTLLSNMVKLSQGMAHCSASRGGILLHGALASWKRRGILLCGASGSGKTTASQRLPSPWRALSDDAAFVVRDRQGRYWAHPWPTWSRFSTGGKLPPTTLGNPVRLAAIFFLKKSSRDRISEVSRKNAIVRLMAASEQAVNLMAGLMPVNERNQQRIDRLDLCCDLTRTTPCFHLGASLKGKFWKLIEKALNLQVPL